MQQTNKKLRLVSQEGSPIVVVSDTVLNQIRYLCKQYPKDEWSGVLFYTYKGSIRNPEKLKITLKEILLMDIGNKTYTSFDWDADIAEFRMNKMMEDGNEDSLDWSYGHIHSHNDMSVFFSVTDNSELEDNAPLTTRYLSLIVNNYLDMTAKLAIPVKPIAVKYQGLDETGAEYTAEAVSEYEPQIHTYSCEMKYNKPEIKVRNGFSERIDQVVRKKEEAKKAQAEKAKTMLPTVYNNQQNNSYGSWEQPKKINNWFNGEVYEEGMLEIDPGPSFGQLTDIETFICGLFRLGRVITTDSPEVAIEDFLNNDFNGKLLSASLKKTFLPLFDKLFKNKPQCGTMTFVNIVIDEIVTTVNTVAKEVDVDKSHVDNTLKAIQEIRVEASKHFNEPSKITSHGI